MSDYRKIKVSRLTHLLNSTPLGTVCKQSQIYRIRDDAGRLAGDGKTIDLLGLATWLTHRILKPTEKPLDDYETVKERARARQAQLSKSGRDIGSIPLITNIDRRLSCKYDFRKFCMTYNPTPFYLGWSRSQLRSAKKLEDTILHKALYAHAEPRASGKTLRCRMATLWALLYDHGKYAFLIGANASKAEASMTAITTWLRFLPTLAEDFPEICYPIQALGGIAQRGNGQLCGGEPTMIGMSADRLVFPTVPAPRNWPNEWPLRGDKVPNSGSVIGASGLTGDGIRGSLITTMNGDQIRPDIVLIDDPQTDESAMSVAQCAEREDLITGAVLYMAGPGKKLAAMMPLTVIREGDFADTMLDREKHPLWRGERSSLLESMPTNMEAWEEYFTIYKRCAQLDPPDFTESNNYYLDHRGTLDEGAVADWEDRFFEDEVSAIQSAMHLYFRNPDKFWTEMQNKPRNGQAVVTALTAKNISAKINRRGRGEVPIGCHKLTAGVDIQGTLLYWWVTAWSSDFTGYVVDYGTWPDQRRSYFILRDIKHTIQEETGEENLEASVYAALDRLSDELCGRAWIQDDQTELRLDKVLIDANWGAITETVYQFCRESRYAGTVMPCHGRFVGAGSAPMDTWQQKPNEQIGLNWRIPPGRGKVKHITYDTNFWKSFLHARLAVPLGGAGCLSLFGDRPDQHRMAADHLVAEAKVLTRGRGRDVDEWKERPGRPDNHWFDCAVQSAVAASMEGCVLFGTEGKAKKQKRQRVSASEMQSRARRGQ